MSFKIALFNKIITNPKKITKAAMVAKMVDAPKDSTTEATKPPMMLAKKDASNHTPIIKDANLGCDNLVTTESPTGERHNSPMV